MKYNNRDIVFLHRLFAEAYGSSVALLSEDQFALWWRSHSDDERQEEYDHAYQLYEEKQAKE